MRKITQAELNDLVNKKCGQSSSFDNTFSIQNLDLSGLSFKEAWAVTSLLPYSPRRMQFKHCKMQNMNFEGMVIEWGLFLRCDLSETSFANSKLDYSQFDHSKFYKTNFKNTRTVGVRFFGTSGKQGVDSFILDYPIYPLDNPRETVLRHVEADKSLLDMQTYHGIGYSDKGYSGGACKTTHCLAGWLTTLHPQGEALEKKYTPGAAASFILVMSGVKVPDFYDTMAGAEERAIEWLRTGKQPTYDEWADKQELENADTE